MKLLVLIFLIIVVYRILTAQVTSIAFLISILTLQLYIVPYFILWDTFREMGLIAEEYDFSFFLFVFLCFAGFILGDWLCYVDIRNNSGTHIQACVVSNSKRFENYSIATGIIGLIGYGFFIYKSGPYYFYGHNSGDFSVGGYVYELRYFIFSSVLLLFNACLDKRLSKKGFLFLIGIALFLAFDAYVQQQRGSWIRFGVIVIFSYLFTQRRQETLKVSRIVSEHKIIFISGFLIGLLLTLTVQLRKFYSPNTSFSQQISLTINRITEKPDLLFGGSGIDEGNEFVTAYNAFQANEIAQTNDFGLKWLYPFINFVPRNLWAGKPTWFTFSTNIFTVMQRYSNIKPAPGSAETGFIDAFYRFLWVAPIFFIFFGYYTRNLHTRARFSFRKRMFYICLYVGCFYFITQNMLPLVIFTLYMYIPVYYINSKCTKMVMIKHA